MEYYIILILAALFILIGTLVYLGLKMSKAQNVAPYPPIAYACPDYWTTDPDGNCIANNINVGGLHTGYMMQPDKITFTGLSPICAKQKWAQNNNIVWSGVSEYNLC